MREPYAMSAPARDAVAERRVEAIDARIRAIAEGFGARAMAYPVLIARSALERAEYPSAFPHLLMVAAPLAKPDLAAGQLLGRENFGEAAWCLSPAVCYHCYVGQSGKKLSEPMVLTARGRCFRNEEWTRPGVRQVEFEMREIVWIGDAAFVRNGADGAKTEVESLARAMGIRGGWQVGEDPFFLPKAQGKAHLQRLMETKLEFMTTGDEPLAIASINHHGPFFGERFAIELADGGPAHSACVAFGLDRWAAQGGRLT